MASSKLSATAQHTLRMMRDKRCDLYGELTIRTFRLEDGEDGEERGAHIIWASGSMVESLTVPMGVFRMLRRRGYVALDGTDPNGHDVYRITDMGRTAITEEVRYGIGS